MENNQKGGKEQGLLELQKHAHNCGYIIPEFSVISESDNEQEIIKIADRFKGKDIIVRSNSVMENTEFGFDGIYKTVVVKNCNFKELKEAYKEVSDSLFSKDAISYRNKAGIPHDSMRVIMQKFIGDDEVSDNEELFYFVMETSINAQGDVSIVMDKMHDFINRNRNYEEITISKDSELIAATDKFFSSAKKKIKKFPKIAIGLQKVFGPVSIEGAFIENTRTQETRIFLFQRRLLPKELYQGTPEIVPDKYTKDDIIFRSKSYRGAGKIENLPIIVMPTIENVGIWESELRKRISQHKSDVFLFVSTMALGKLSSRILNDYTALAGVKAIISREGIDFSSHAFKVASLARIPFVSVQNLHHLERASAGSLFFTENEAVFCMDEKRDEFNFNRIKKSEATSLKALTKKKGISIELSEDEQNLSFHLDLKHFTFKDTEIAFHRLLEDVSGEVWLLTGDGISIGFRCENSKGQIIKYSGWANYLKDEGHLRLDNFGDCFENNQIEWSLIQKIATELNVPNNVQS